MAKVDGRNLRKAINGYLREHHPGVSPRFNIRTITKKVYFRKYAVLEVRFDELDDNLTVWEDVADFVQKEWWPGNERFAKAKIREWDGGYRGEMISRTIPITDVEVGYGFLL